MHLHTKCLHNPTIKLQFCREGFAFWIFPTLQPYNNRHIKVQLPSSSNDSFSDDVTPHNTTKNVYKGGVNLE